MQEFYLALTGLYGGFIVTRGFTPGCRISSFQDLIGNEYIPPKGGTPNYAPNFGVPLLSGSFNN